MRVNFELGQWKIGLDKWIFHGTYLMDICFKASARDFFFFSQSRSLLDPICRHIAVPNQRHISGLIAKLWTIASQQTLGGRHKPTGSNTDHHPHGAQQPLANRCLYMHHHIWLNVAQHLMENQHAPTHGAQWSPATAGRWLQMPITKYPQGYNHKGMRWHLRHDYTRIQT